MNEVLFSKDVQETLWSELSPEQKREFQSTIRSLPEKPGLMAHSHLVKENGSIRLVSQYVMTRESVVRLFPWMEGREISESGSSEEALRKPIHQETNIVRKVLRDLANFMNGG